MFSVGQLRVWLHSSERALSADLCKHYMSCITQVLVLETCSGLVTGAVAERLGGFGHVCTTYVGDKCPPLEATRMFNFPDSIRSSMSTASLATLLQYQNEPAADEAGQAAEDEGKGAEEAAHKEAGQQTLQAADALLDSQQVAGMNGSTMRAVLDARSEQPQEAVLAGLADSGQPRPDPAGDSQALV